MPGTTRCHVNMAGYSSSSCIFCCFNEWGKFCQAHTTWRRYSTCVLSYSGVMHTAGPKEPVGSATVTGEVGRKTLPENAQGLGGALGNLGMGLQIPQAKVINS